MGAVPVVVERGVGAHEVRAIDAPGREVLVRAVDPGIENGHLDAQAPLAESDVRGLLVSAPHDLGVSMLLGFPDKCVLGADFLEF